MEQYLTHINQKGEARMVDVATKPETARVAKAKGEVKMQANTLSMILDNQIKKGDVLSVAKLAGVMAAKRTFEFIPLCHPIPINHISVETEVDPNLPGIQITAQVNSFSRTGVEMEALTAVCVAALTVYDMAKSVDKKMQIQNIRLIKKQGGMSGDVVND